jgi:hypothetical protein
MEKAPGKGLFIAYVVVAVLVAASMFFSASAKLTLHPGAVKTIHEDAGVPLGLFPVLAAWLIAAGIGLLAGIRWPKVGVAAGVALVVYFVGAVMAHVLAGHPAEAKSPLMPLLMAVTVLTLRIVSWRRRPA